MPPSVRPLAVAATCLALGMTACSGAGSRGSVTRAATATASAPGDPTTEAPTTATTPTSAATTSTTHPAPAGPPVLAAGSKGPEVKALEQRLSDLKYDVGAVDGVYDTVTTQAVIAFQKVNGMPRTGKAGPDVVAAVQRASAPAPLLPAAEPFRIEIDLPRQVLFLYEGGQLVRTIAISSGGGYRYCVDGRCDRAITPGGSFRVGTKIKGPHKSPLGMLYNPLFFNGGIAIHGEPSVPATPASHGCVRIPMSASLWFFNEVPRGTPVYVIGGPKAPVPFNVAAPDGTPPSSPQSSPTTTTTAPPTTTSTSTSTSTTAPTTSSTTPTSTSTTSSTTTSSTTSSTAPPP